MSLYPVYHAEEKAWCGQWFGFLRHRTPSESETQPLGTKQLWYLTHNAPLSFVKIWRQTTGTRVPASVWSPCPFLVDMLSSFPAPSSCLVQESSSEATRLRGFINWDTKRTWFSYIYVIWARSKMRIWNSRRMKSLTRMKQVYRLGEGVSHVGICFIDDCFLFKAMGYWMWCLSKSPRGARRIGPMHPFW